MHSLVSLQGASRTTGGIFWGNAYGNKLNHADFELEDDLGVHMLIKPKLAFKIFVYVQYGDVLKINRIPDFNSQFPITVFFLNEKALLARPLLEKAAQYHDSISCKLCHYWLIKYNLIFYIDSYVFFFFILTCLAIGYGILKGIIL